MAPRKKDSPPLSDEERRLFLEALGEVERSAPVRFNPTTKKPVKQAPRDEDFADLLSEGFGSHPEFIQKQQIEHTSTAKKAKPRGDSIEATIDLHASTLDMALKRTEEFLIRCHLKRFRKVLIIHGKGSGILRDGVRKYLEHHPHVAQLTSAGRHQGGEGAVIALLRQ